MYIIEALPPMFTPIGEDSAFYCVPDPSEHAEQNLRRELEAKLIPLTLGALAVEAIEERDASGLLCAIYERDDTFFEISQSLRGAFLEVAQRAHLENRADQCISQAAKGLLTSQALSQELAAIAAVDGATFATWLTSEGIYSGEGYEIDAEEAAWYDLEDIDNSRDLALAKELGANGFAWQYQLVFEQHEDGLGDEWQRPVLLSSLRHRQLLAIDNKGEYVPQATILNSEHPVRRQEGYVWSKGFAEAKRAIAGLHFLGRNAIEVVCS